MAQLKQDDIEFEEEDEKKAENVAKRQRRDENRAAERQRDAGALLKYLKKKGEEKCALAKFKDLIVWRGGAFKGTPSKDDRAALIAEWGRVKGTDEEMYEKAGIALDESGDEGEGGEDEDEDEEEGGGEDVILFGGDDDYDDDDDDDDHHCRCRCRSC